MPDRVRIDILRTTAELEHIVGEWRTLWQRNTQATPFQSPEWLLPWWHHFGQRELRTVTIRDRDELIGLLPLYLYPDLRSHKQQLLPLGVGTTDYLDGIFAPRCTAEHIRDALRVLGESTGWDEACFSQLQSGSRLLQVGDRRDIFPTEACSRTPAVPIADLPRKLRQNVRYYRNRARRIGRIDFTFATEHNCMATFETLHRLHTERWQQDGQSGVLADPRVIAWHREALPQLARAGTLWLCSLALSGETVAVMYALADPPNRTHRTLYVYLPSYSIHHAEIRPGTMLQAMAMEYAAQQGFESVDLLRGDEPYKQLWHPEKTPTYGFVLYPHRAYRIPPQERAA